MYSGRFLSWVWILLTLLFRHALSSVSSALSVTPSSTWYGDDGSWSAVSIRVGSPQQWVDVLVSTASSETWVVSPGGCDGTPTCTSKRGGLFDFNKSSTWQTEGVFELGLDTPLGFGGDASYGLDTLEFGTTGATLENTIIGSINTTEYWLGFFGLGNIPGNFTNIQVPSPVSALENKSVIPSNSYGYTAGAIYQAKSEPCSLTLGGYDANRFIPHNISFELNPIHQPEAWLNSISVAASPSSGKPQNWSSNSLQLLAPSSGVYVTIDSSTPFLWLPKSVCESFAQALGLTYNDSLALYTFDRNASRHDDLKTWNLNFTFSLSDTSNPSQIVNITLPYAAFDLQLSYPFIPNTTYETGNKYYFPLRQAANDTQYILGRSFLQEAYIITDYERNNFSVHQAVHPADPLGNISIVNILKPGTSATQPSGQTPSTPLSTPLIIGIAVGSAAFLLLVGLAIFLICRRQRQRLQHSRRHQSDAILLLDPKPSLSPSPTLPLPPPSTSAGSTIGGAGTASTISPSLHTTTTTPSSPSTAFASSLPASSGTRPGTSTSSFAAAAIGGVAYEADSMPITPRSIPRTTGAGTGPAPAEISADASHERFELSAGTARWPEELDGRSVSGFHRGDEKFVSGVRGGWEGGEEWGGENGSGGKFRLSVKVKTGKMGAGSGVGGGKVEEVGRERERERDRDREREAEREGQSERRNFGRARFSWETGGY